MTVGLFIGDLLDVVNASRKTHVFLFCFVLPSEHMPCTFISQKVDILCGIGIKKVACGTQFSVALTKDGHVYTFGQGKVSFSLRCLLYMYIIETFAFWVCSVWVVFTL